MNSSLVSVITPSYNSAKYIAETIRSVQQQTWRQWEMIIVDDCSTDDTIEVIQQFATEDPRIKLHLLQTNSGTGAAREFATKMAEGQFIAFLDSDDIWKPEKLAVQLEFMEEHKLPFTFSFYDCIDEDGNALGKTIKAPIILTYNQLTWSNWVGNLTAIYNVGYFGKIEISNIRKRQDWMLWLTIVKKIGFAKPVPQSLALYRIRTASVSSSKVMLLKHNYNVYRKFHKFGAVKSMLCMGKFLYTHFLIRPKFVKAI